MIGTGSNALWAFAAAAAPLAIVAGGGMIWWSQQPNFDPYEKSDQIVSAFSNAPEIDFKNAMPRGEQTVEKSPPFSIVKLSFDNLSDDPAQVYPGDEKPDQIVNAFSKAPEIDFKSATPRVEQTVEKLPPDSKRVVVVKPLRANYVIYFAHDNYDINDEAKATLQEMVSVASQFGVRRMLVHGHSDRSGPVDYNQHLSERRAVKVIEFLAGLGHSGDLVEMKAYGELRPKVPTADGVRESVNRRVEIDFWR